MTIKRNQAKRKSRKYKLDYLNPTLAVIMSDLFEQVIFEEIPNKYFIKNASDYFSNDKVAAIWTGETSVLIAFFKDPT